MSIVSHPATREYRDNWDKIFNHEPAESVDNNDAETPLQDESSDGSAGGPTPVRDPAEDVGTEPA